MKLFSFLCVLVGIALLSTNASGQDCGPPNAVCDALEPVKLVPSGYKALGGVKKVSLDASGNTIEIYETADNTPTTMLIAVHDAAGLVAPLNNIWQISDKLAAELKVRVVLPNFYQKGAFGATVENYAALVKPDLLKVIAYYKAAGITKFGMFGFCFGGKMTALATGDADLSDIKLGVQFHAAQANLVESALINRPTLLLPGANDPDPAPHCQAVKSCCKHYQFLAANHGYAGGSAAWTNETILRTAEDAVTRAKKFICLHLNPAA